MSSQGAARLLARRLCGILVWAWIRHWLRRIRLDSVPHRGWIGLHALPQGSRGDVHTQETSRKLLVLKGNESTPRNYPKPTPRGLPSAVVGARTLARERNSDGFGCICYLDQTLVRTTGYQDAGHLQQSSLGTSIPASFSASLRNITRSLLGAVRNVEHAVHTGTATPARCGEYKPPVRPETCLRIHVTGDL